MGSNEINMTNMMGASNKPFDYLAVGMMPLVSDLPSWREALVEPGYALACDPSSIDSLVAAMTWCAENPVQVREIGERGRLRITKDWNYEFQFARVMQRLLKDGCPVVHENFRSRKSVT